MRWHWRRKWQKIKWIFTIQFFIGCVLSALIIIPIKISKDPILLKTKVETMELQTTLMDELSKLMRMCMDQVDEIEKSNGKGGDIECEDSND